MNAQTGIMPSLVVALTKALAELEGVKKNKENPHLKNKYPDLSSAIEAIQPIAAHGLWYRQVSKRDPDGALIETFYIHESGDELSAGETFVPAAKKDPQGFGSALTYCRRYALLTAFGLAPEDDDGEAAAQSYRKQNQASGRDPAKAEESRDEPSRITKPQWSKIVALLEATNANADAILKHFKVDDLKKLTDAQAIKAINQLEDKLASMAKAETNRASGAQSDAADELADTDIPY